jgi:hypothetical protein
MTEACDICATGSYLSGQSVTPWRSRGADIQIQTRQDGNGSTSHGLRSAYWHQATDTAAEEEQPLSVIIRTSHRKGLQGVESLDWEEGVWWIRRQSQTNPLAGRAPRRRERGSCCYSRPDLRPSVYDKRALGIPSARKRTTSHRERLGYRARESEELRCLFSHDGCTTSCVYAAPQMRDVAPNTEAEA